MFYSVLVVRPVLTFPQKATRQPHVTQPRVFPDAPRQSLASGSDANITEPIRDILFAFGSRPAQSEEDEDSVKLVENFISLFPGLAHIS